MIADDRKFSRPVSNQPDPPEGDPFQGAAFSDAEGSDGEESVDATVTRLQGELAAAAAEAERSHDRYLRERAELENVKKRLQRDKSEALRFANEALVRDLLPAIDNLERAVEHAEGGEAGQALGEGVRLVLKSALAVLERHGVRRIEAIGQPFDPTLHEAIAQVPDPAREPNHVVQQFLPGYLLHERLLRPAQVSVSTTPSVETP